MGFLYGKRRALEALPTFREDFIPDKIPLKIEVGTFVYENVAGMDAAISYLEELGTRVSARLDVSRRGLLQRAMEGVRVHEAALSIELLRRLSKLDGVTVYGHREPSNIHLRVPTVCFNLRGIAPSAVAARCAENNIGVRDGNMYSPRLLERLGIPPATGAVRASLVHYNTLDEIERFVDVLAKMIAG
jgi:selenocysteine lyase/cysteine desulfurase